MCKICGSLFCPPACPSYSGVSAELGKPIAKCCECGDYIYEEDMFYAHGKRFFCADCALDI